MECRYQLYGGRFTRALIVQMVMAEGGLDYDLHEVDLINNEHRSPEFLALNPAGFIPVLIKPDGEVVTETPAINLYLADHHGLTDLAPALEDPDRAGFLSSLFFLSDELEPILKQYFYPQRYAIRAEDAAALKQAALMHGIERLAIIEDSLQAKGPYHLGERFSLVDIILCFWAEYFNFDQVLEPFPAIRDCLDRVTNRPLLRPYFDELIECRIEYRRLQATGGGVK